MATATFPPQLIPARLRAAIRAIRGRDKQEYCAERIGYSRRQWIRWEQGAAIPSERAIEKIKEVFPAFKVT